MMKIAKSLAMIAFVAAIGVYATSSFFSDTETSTNNTFTAGTIDISVDGENPWTTSWENYLDKPCETNYMNFVIKNEGENPANVWKHLWNVRTDGGIASYPPDGSAGPDGSGTVEPVASSEPEYVENGGGFTYDTEGKVTGYNTSGYEEQANLAAYMIYDMAVCRSTTGATLNCPYINDSEDPNNGKKPLIQAGNDWYIVINEDQQIRVDNVSCNWIYLGELQSGEEMIVSQSYHLMAWDDAGVETITNWAQGDVMTFDIELEARQLSAPAPVSPNSGTLVLENKDSEWKAITGDNIGGTLAYNTSGSSFDYTLNATGLQDADYCLIYYPDPWPGEVGGFAVKCGLIPSSGVINHVGSADIGSIPISTDANHPVGAKLWLVLDSDYDETEGKMTDWSMSDYLFEMNLIKYDKI